jgi:uncharacterized membrane protein YjdF
MFFPLIITINSLALLLCLFCAITTTSVGVFIMEVIFIVLNAYCIVVNVRAYRRNKKCSEEKNQN